MEDQSSIHAAIDIGSNTIHIVVARAESDDVHIVADEVELVRIGESVNATGEISVQKRDAALVVLQQYLTLATHHHAQPVLAVATEAIRKASNGAAFLADMARETGLKVQMVDGNVEALLSFYGATYELFKTVDVPALVGVMDLGGGSAELVMSRQKQITWRTSLPIGSGWLYDRYLHTDPPTLEEMDSASSFLHTFFKGLSIKRFPAVLIVTGGSANSLLHLAHAAFGLKEDDMCLTRDTLLRCEGLLGALSAQEVAQRYDQPLARAKILPAGALMLRLVMEHLQLHEIVVSPHGIREGMLLAYARWGERWLQQVQRHSKAVMQGKQEVTDVVQEQKAREEEPFHISGRRLLLERVRKMLDWREEVLAHQDSEAVHKMRVATRRLRAALDAYEIICTPKQFKRVYHRVKEIADVLGQARDTDVLIESLRDQLEQVTPEEQAGLRWLIESLTTFRLEHQQRLEVFFNAFDEEALKKQSESSLFV